MTRLIGAGGFAHVIAARARCSTPRGAAKRPGRAPPSAYALPSLIGNMLGGITLVAALNHAQVEEG